MPTVDPLLQGNQREYDERPAIERDDLEPFAGVGAGFSLEMDQLHSTGKRTAAAFGLRVEGGYVWSPALSLAFDDIEADPPDQQLAVRGAPLGELDRSGAYLTFGLFFRF